MSKTIGKSIFVGLFTAILSAVTLILLFNQVGSTGNKGMDDMETYLPYLIGAALGYYAGKLAQRVLASQTSV